MGCSGAARRWKDRKIEIRFSARNLKAPRTQTDWSVM